MLIFAFPLFVALGAAVVALRREESGALLGYRLLLAFGVAPYPLYVSYAWGYVTRSSFEGPEGGTPVYPGLVAFAAAGLGLTAALLAGATLLARRWPLLAAPLPVALGLLFWTAVLPLAHWRGPAFLMLDNMPLIWLLAWSVFASAVLLVVGWLALGRPRAARAGP